jgi:hypothetical protein
MRRLLVVVFLTACGGMNAPKTMGGICDGYPCGPYGYGAGAVTANLTLSGRHDANGNGSVLDDPIAPIRFSDYYSDTQLRALVISFAADWCEPCKTEQSLLKMVYGQDHSKGVALLEVVLQDQGGAPTTSMTVPDAWAQTYQLPFDVAYDPMQALMPYYTSTSFPQQMIVRTHDMTITWVNVGAADSLQANLDPLLTP